MKHTIKTLIFSLTISTYAHAQNPMPMEWGVCIKQGWSLLARSIAETPDKKGYLILGYASSDTLLGNIINTGYPDSTGRVIVLKLDTAGNYIWHKFGNDFAMDFAASVSKIIFTKDKGFVIAGATNNRNRPATGNDIYVAKYDSNANLQWEHFWGGSHPIDPIENVIDIIQIRDGNLVVTGQSNSYNYDMMNLNPCAFPPCSPGQIVGLIYKLNINTGALMQMKYTPIKIKSIYEEPDSTLRGCGNSVFQAYTPNLDPLGPAKIYGVVNYSLGFGKMVRLSNGEYLISGTTNIQSEPFCSANMSGPNFDGIVMKVDNLGNMLNTQCYGDAGLDGLQMIVADTLGSHQEYYLFGARGLREGWIYKIDALGAKLWEQTYASYAIINDAIVDSRGDLVLVAGAKFSPDPVCSSGYNAFVVVKYRKPGVNTKDISNENSNWQINATQANTYAVQFLGDATKYPIEVNLTDALGKNIANYTATTSELNIDLSKYQQGIYFLSAKGYKTVKLGR
jgi:hypothetical protein